MKCPSCRNPDLKPTRLDDFPVHGCPDCSGALVSLLYYRDWAEHHPEECESSSQQNLAPDETPDTSTAIGCPKCARVMTKYRMTSNADNRLDFCSSCDEVWLDSGEWELLNSLQLQRNMSSVLTDEWQRRIRHELSEARRRERLVNAVGEETAEKADEVRSWLKDHPQLQTILRYIGHQ